VKVPVNHLEGPLDWDVQFKSETEHTRQKRRPK
jgi:hypothetical protein